MARKKATFEFELDALRTIVEQLEQGNLPLEEGVSLYKKGLSLAQSCRKRLSTATNEVKIYQDELLKEFEAIASEGRSEDENGDS